MSVKKKKFPRGMAPTVTVGVPRDAYKRIRFYQMMHGILTVPEAIAAKFADVKLPDSPSE